MPATIAADLEALTRRYGAPDVPVDDLETLAHRYSVAGEPPATPVTEPRATARWRVTIDPGGGAQRDSVEVPGQWQDALDAVTALRTTYREGTRFDVSPVEVPREPAPPERIVGRTPGGSAIVDTHEPANPLAQARGDVVESLNPAELVILGGGTAAGAGLGALRGPVSRIVGAGAGSLVAHRVNKGVGYTPGAALGPVDAGDVLATGIPMVGETLAMVGSKIGNMRRGNIGTPEDRRLIDLAQQHGINEGLTYGDVVGPQRNPALARRQTLLERTPGGFQTRVTGQAQSKAAAEGVQEHYAGQVAGAYEGLPAVQAAARAGDREARFALRLADAASDTDPGAVIQASAQVKLVRDKLQADALYTTRDRLAATLGNRIETPETLRAAYTALDQARGSVLNLDPRGTTTKQLEKILTRLEPTRTPSPGLPGVLPDVDVPPLIRYQDLTSLRHELDIAINKTSATPFEQELLGTIREGVQTDMRQAALQSGTPQLVAAQEAADRFWPGVIRQRDMVNRIADLHPDQVVPRLIQRGQAGRALEAFNALDAKGQAAVRSDILNRALYDGNAPAIHPGTGHFSPARLAKNLEDQRAATGIFFPTRGEGQWELRGFSNLLRHLERNGAYIENPPTGQRLLDTLSPLKFPTAIASGYALGNVKGALLAGVAEPAMEATRAALTRWALMTPRGRDFMLAASDLAPGSRALQSLLQAAAKDTPGLQPFVGRLLNDEDSER